MPLLRLDPYRMLGMELEIIFQPPSTISPGCLFPQPVGFRFNPYIFLLDDPRPPLVQKIPWIPQPGESLHFEARFITRDIDLRSEAESTPLDSSGAVRTRPLIDILSDRFNILSDRKSLWIFLVT